MSTNKLRQFIFLLWVLPALINGLWMSERASAQDSAGHQVFLPMIIESNTNPPSEPPSEPVNAGLVFHKDKPLRSADVAVDRQNGLHFVYIADTKNTVHYAYCPGDNPASCATSAGWGVAALDKVEAFVQISLTPDGRPRLWLKNGTVKPVYSYAECDAACTNPQNWLIVDLVSSFDWLPDQREFDWHLDTFSMTQGRPRLVYNYTDDLDVNEHGLYYAGCDSDCTNAGQWFSVKIAENNGLSRPVLALTVDGRPRIVGTSIALTNMIVYMECNQGCESAANWSMPLELFPRGDGAFTDFPSWSFQVNQQNGGPRLVYHFADIGTYYIWCNDNCTNLDNWFTNDEPIVAGQNGQTPALALDAQGRPRVAFRDVVQDGLGYAWCDADCESGQPQWRIVMAEPTSTLDQEYPVPPFFNCTDGDWVSGLRPSLALDTQGNPRIAFDADHLQNCFYGPPVNDPPFWKTEAKWWTSRLLLFPKP